MRSIFPTIFAALILSSALLAEEKPAPTTPVETPAEAPAKDPSKPPVFPLTSEFFSEIEEDYTNEEGAMKIEKFALLDIVAAIKASTPEQLKASIDKEADFRKLMVFPEKFRGHVVQFDSTFRYVYSLPIKDEDLSGKPITLYHGQVSSRGNLISFASIDPLPDGLQPGQTVRFTGVMMKRFAYLNKRKPGVELTWTPLIVIQKLEPYKEPEGPTTSYEMFVGYILFTLVGVALFIAYSSRNKGRVARNNPFTKKKLEKSNSSTIFPGPKK